MTLALDYRPKTFGDVVGQRSVRVVLQQMVLSDKVPSALMFEGPRGTGKTSTARLLAAALNCDGWPKGPCGDCARCRATFAGSSTDVLEVDAASNGGVDDVRQLRDAVRYSVGGRRRVVLLDEVQSMSNAAFNALLKTLEEPPPTTHFVLLTTEPARVLETVVSRCVSFEFSRISIADVVERLRAILRAEGLWPDGEAERAAMDEVLAAIADRADGGLRDAVMRLEQVVRVGVRNIDSYRLLTGDVDFAPGIIKALAAGDTAGALVALDGVLQRTGDYQDVGSQLVRVLRDVLVLRAGGALACQGQALVERRALAASLEPVRVVQALRVLWDLRTRVRALEDPRSSLELAVVMVGEGLTGGVAPAASAPAAPRRLTIDEMRSTAARVAG